MTSQSIYEPRTRSTLRRLAIRNAEYSINEWGDASAPLLVYLHGFADCGATFQFVVDEFREDWFVVAPDWRGFGQTSADAVAFWFPDYLADLDHLLRHYAGDRPVVLVGHSMGGNVAGLYAGALPERVAAFVNIEGFGLPDSDPADAPARYRDWLLKSRDRPGAVERDGFTQLAEAIRRRNPRLTAARAEFVARCWAEQTASGRVRLRMHPAHKLPNPVLYRLAEAEACWREITAPVLVLTGSESSFAAPDELPFRSARTVRIEGAGHMLHFEQPERVASAIEAFLGEAAA